MQIYSWLNRAKAYVAKEQSLANKLSENTFTSLSSYTNMLKNRRVAKKLILNKAILTDGYILLNEIGETIRGEEIKYSITASKTGAALSKGQATGGVYTWTVPLSEFINLLNFTSQRITLKDSSTIYKILETQIQKSEKNLIYEKWSDEKLQSFAIFSEQVRTNPKWPQWNKVNEGNLLEAFLRFIGEGHTPQIHGDKNYWYSIGSAMKRTMMAPDKFFVGGDINDIQIKGLNASVTNLNTLIQNLEKVLKILFSTHQGYETLNKHVKKNFTKTFSKDLSKTEEDITNELIDFFTSKINRAEINLTK